MTQEMSEKEIYEVAKKRVRQKKDFYNHLVIYVIINILLVIIWALTGSGYPWFVWPLAGWGIGILFHAADVYIFHKESAWEKREVEKEVDKLKKS